MSTIELIYDRLPSYEKTILTAAAIVIFAKATTIVIDYFFWRLKRRYINNKSKQQ